MRDEIWRNKIGVVFLTGLRKTVLTISISKLKNEAPGK
jgi:hypothetical protein